MLVSPGIGSLFACYLLLFLAYLGWGKLSAALLGLDLRDRGTCFPYVWLGWATSLVVLQTIHLVLPLAPWVSAVFFFIGLAYLVQRSFAKETVLAGIRRVSGAYWLFLVLGGGWIAAHALTEPKLYDSGLYHFNSIRWLLEHPLVPGLGNLHGRLAFNQTFFIYVASLQVFQPLASGHNLANSFLLILVLAECAFPLFDRARAGDRLMLLVKLAFLPLVLVYGKNYALSSPSPDLGSAILRIVLFYHFVDILLRFRAGQRDIAGIKHSVLLAAVAITIKLSNIMYAVALTLLCGLLHFARGSRLRGVGSGKNLVFAGVVLIFLGLWAGRGVVLSGCPLYPSSAFCLDVEWAVPAEQVATEAEMVYRSVRSKTTSKVPQDYLVDRSWMVKWFDRMWQWKAGFAYPAMLAVAAICAAVASIAIARDKVRRRGNLLLALAIIPPLSALVFWFVTAPHPRFADPFLFLLALAGFLPWLADTQHFRVRLLLVPVILVAINTPLLLTQLERGLSPEIVMKWSPAAEPVPQVEMERYRTASGLEIYTTASGDQCWDSALPSSPYRNPDLRLRGDSLRAGFVSRNSR